MKLAFKTVFSAACMCLPIDGVNASEISTTSKTITEQQIECLEQRLREVYNNHVAYGHDDKPLLRNVSSWFDGNVITIEGGGTPEDEEYYTSTQIYIEDKGVSYLSEVYSPGGGHFSYFVDINASHANRYAAPNIPDKIKKVGDKNHELVTQGVKFCLGPVF